MEVQPSLDQLVEQAKRIAVGTKKLVDENPQVTNTAAPIIPGAQGTGAAPSKGGA